MQVHYHRNGEAIVDQTKLGLYFAKEPVQTELRSFPILNFSFYIPPGSSHQKVTAQIVLPANIKVIGATPHMHLIGTQIKLEATLPNGKKQCMVNIPQWDFRWQGTYTFKEPLSLPAGTKLKVTSYYNNSDSNPNQPNHPLKPITWGEQTTDEMCLAFVSYILDSKKGASAMAGLSAPVMMNGMNLADQSLIRLQSGLLSSSPGEMYNWSSGFTREDLNILPWHKDPTLQQTQQRPHCH